MAGNRFNQQTPIVTDLVIQSSRNGKGIYAMRDFDANEVLYEVTGELMTCNEDDVVDETTRSNTFRYSEELFISPAGTIGDFQNHSCAPNAKVLKDGSRLYIAAHTPIPQGEEIVIDYSTIIGADDMWAMTCNCGSDMCRARIRSYDMLPKKLREQYAKDGMVPDYIQAL